MARSSQRLTLATFTLLASITVGAALQSATVRDRQDAVVPVLDLATKQQVIEGAVAHMRRAYIFADVADRMAEDLEARLSRKEYDGIDSPQAFAEVLTTHLQAVSRDKHLRVFYSEEGLRPRSAPTPADLARFLEDERRRNFGFVRVERLEGNVGYIELLGFSGSDEVSEAAVPAMNFVANTDALIFDLRRNGGGSPLTIGLLSSYLFDEVVHLNDFYVRETDSHQQFYTSPEVQGRRYGAKKPVYVLTSSRTFSAAEEFTYNLKNLERATIVGQTTGGGAHPGGVRRITEHFGIWLPNGRAINPITKTNWEGVGVVPDIDVGAEEALHAAHVDALKRLRQSEKDPRRREQLDAAIASVEKGATPPR